MRAATSDSVCAACVRDPASLCARCYSSFALQWETVQGEQRQKLSVLRFRDIDYAKETKALYGALLKYGVVQ